MRYRIVAVMMMAMTVLAASAKTVNPKNYGVTKTNDPAEVYRILKKVHTLAHDNGWDVSYKGVKKLNVEITADATPLPLTANTDFAGVTLTVTNKAKNIYLYELSDAFTALDITKEQFNNGSYLQRPELQTGTVLLFIEDTNPWVAHRQGYNGAAIRRDMVVIADGQPTNQVVYPYTSESSKPRFSYLRTDTRRKTVKNINMVRTADCTFITDLIQIAGQNNVSLTGISLSTPESTLYGDRAIMLTNSANISVSNVKIRGTYSATDKWGYGLALENVYNTSFTRLDCKCPWGVFGSNNVNRASLTDSDVNRFDIHCYGRDVRCERVTFRDLYNQFSSLYGYLEMTSCRFYNFTPILLEPSYFAYTPFKATFTDCYIDFGTALSAIVKVGNLDNMHADQRPELSRIYLPDVTLRNVLIIQPPQKSTCWIFSYSGKADFAQLPSIVVDRVTMSPAGSTLRVFNYPFDNRNRTPVRLSNSPTLQFVI